MKSLIFFAAFATVVGLAVSQKFDKSVVGVAFSPYVDSEPARLWNEYSVNDIKRMLGVVGNFFSQISTYSMGTATYNNGQSWDRCDSNALIARAAAQLNRDSGKDFRVNIGAYQNSDDQNREIDNAFLAAQDANSISPNTVWGITFTNEYVVNAATANNVLGMIRNNKNRAQQLGLKLGMRTHICGVITENSDLGNIFRDIIRESDFVYCNVYPSTEHVRLGAARAAQEVGYYVNGLKPQFLNVKGNLDFRIGETGWPSQDNSFNDSENNVNNLVAYWKGLNDWAKTSRVQTQMFQAMNEPWKGANSQFKAESHYGWFNKESNDRNDHRYREKETNQIYQ